MNRLLRPLLFLGIPLLLAAGIRIAPLLAQDAASPPPAPSAPPAGNAAEERPPPSQDDIAPEAGPGDRISADNNVSFPVDI